MTESELWEKAYRRIGFLDEVPELGDPVTVIKMLENLAFILPMAKENGHDVYDSVEYIALPDQHGIDWIVRAGVGNNGPQERRGEFYLAVAAAICALPENA